MVAVLNHIVYLIYNYKLIFIHFNRITYFINLHGLLFYLRMKNSSRKYDTCIGIKERYKSSKLQNDSLHF
jgi:hypothetical protein